MHNWSTDTKALRRNPEKYVIWKLEQLINYGLGGDKLDTGELIKYWDRLHIDSKKRDALSFLLWKKRS